MNADMDLRIGHGQDAHRLRPGLALVLGGVRVPSPHGLEGHSDGDVLCHAVTDALLGAAGLGDIGMYFPSSQARWKGAHSLALLRRSWRLVAGGGWAVESLHVVVSLESPKLSTFREEMEKNLSEAVSADVGAVNVTSTTTDGLGFVGRYEGASASAVVLLSRRKR